MQSLTLSLRQFDLLVIRFGPLTVNRIMGVSRVWFREFLHVVGLAIHSFATPTTVSRFSARVAAHFTRP